MEIKCLNGLLYNLKKKNFSKLVAPPYDVLSKTDVNKLYSLSPYNIVRLDFGKILKNDNEKNNRYSRSATLLNKWLKSGVLVEEKQPTIYIYSQEFIFEGKKYERTGIICDLKLEQFNTGKVCPHEFTLSKPKTDRLNLLESTNCNFSEIFCIAFDNKNNINEFILEEKKQSPFIKFKYIDCIINTLWKITDCEKIKKLEKYFKNERLLIADGHHRYETALNYQNIMNKKAGPGPWDFVPVYILSKNDSGVLVLPTHRIINFEGIFEVDTLLKNISRDFNIIKREKLLMESELKIQKNEIILVSGETNYILTLKDKIFTGFDELQKFPTSILNNLILKKIKQKYSVSYEKDIKNVLGAIHLINEKNQGNSILGFILPKTEVKAVINIARKGERLPEKSTYFYPKILTGLVMRLIK